MGKSCDFPMTQGNRMHIDHCYQPWMELQIEYNHRVGCCCYYKGKTAVWDFDRGNNFSLPLYWNGPELKAVRQIVRDNKVIGSGCSRCQFVEYGIPALPEALPVRLDEKQKRNYQKAVSSFQNKDIIVESFPVRYYFNFGLPCNLDCVMCSQEDLRARNYELLPANLFDNLSDYFQLAEQIGVIGGEPFVVPSARAFIQKFNVSPRLHNVRLALFTNGTLLHKHMDLFDRTPYINFCVSLDSIGEGYERIRRGARWGRTEKNIHTVLDYGKSQGFDWRMNIASVLMKTSLANILPYVRWCTDQNLPCHFVPISPNSSNREEDIFSFPQLLYDIPHWENHLDQAIELLDKVEWANGASERLKIMKVQLDQRLRLYAKNPKWFRFHGELDGGSVLSKIVHGRFMIWGTGSYYETHYSELIQEYDGGAFVGFIDNNASRWGSLLDGSRIYSPDQAMEETPEFIIIASAMRNEIVDQIISMGWPTCEIL